MNYKHIILTRFNLQYDLLSDIHIQDNWLEERFRLFEQYCFPSIIAQTNQQFDWVILLSEYPPTSPPHYVHLGAVALLRLPAPASYPQTYAMCIPLIVWQAPNPQLTTSHGYAT